MTCSVVRNVYIYIEYNEFHVARRVDAEIFALYYVYYTHFT